MKLFEFTALHDENPDKVSHIRFVAADHPEEAKRKEWLVGQVAIDEPTHRNGAVQRVKALEKARAELDALIRHFQSLADQSRSGT